MVLYCVLIGLVLASSYCRADERVERGTLEQLEQRMEKIEDELEHGGKQYQKVRYDSKSLYTEPVETQLLTRYHGNAKLIAWLAN